MKILAKSKAGHTFIYNPTSAHEVSERSGRTIMDILNRVRYDIKFAKKIKATLKDNYVVSISRIREEHVGYCS